MLSRGSTHGDVSVTVAPGATISDPDRARWGELYVELRPLLVRALLATSGSYDAIEDAVQEAFVAGMQRSPEELVSPVGWLYTVALNKLRSHHRRAALAARLRLRPRSDPKPLDDVLRRADVVKTLLALPERDRALLVAKHYLGLKQEEIAEHLKLPRGTVASALSRAAARFRAVEAIRE